MKKHYTQENYKISYLCINKDPSFPTLCFLHGMGSSHKAWKHYISYFRKKECNIIAIDMRGHGKSDRPNDFKDYIVDKVADDIAEIIKKESCKHITLIGYCYGGMVALKVNELHPKLVDKLVIISSSATTPLPSFSGYLLYYMLTPFSKAHFSHLWQKYNRPLRDYTKHKGENDWNLKRLAKNVMHTGILPYGATLYGISQYDVIKTIKKTKTPIILIHGENDTVISVKESMHIQEQLPHAQIIVLKDSNHLVILDREKELIPLFKSLLQTKEEEYIEK